MATNQRPVSDDVTRDVSTTVTTAAADESKMRAIIKSDYVTTNTASSAARTSANKTLDINSNRPDVTKDCPASKNSDASTEKPLPSLVDLVSAFLIHFFSFHFNFLCL